MDKIMGSEERKTKEKDKKMNGFFIQNGQKNSSVSEVDVIKNLYRIRICTHNSVYKVVGKVRKISKKQGKASVDEGKKMC